MATDTRRYQQNWLLISNNAEPDRQVVNWINEPRWLLLCTDRRYWTMQHQCAYACFGWSRIRLWDLLPEHPAKTFHPIKFMTSQNYFDVPISNMVRHQWACAGGCKSLKKHHDAETRIWLTPQHNDICPSMRTNERSSAIRVKDWLHSVRIWTFTCYLYIIEPRRQIHMSLQAVDGAHR